MATPTPFDITYEALLAHVLTRPDVAAVLKERNLIKYNARDTREKHSVQTADLPEIAIFMSAVRGNVHASSSHAAITTVWEYLFSTGTFDTGMINMLVFQTICSFVDKDSLFALTWKDRVFIKDVRLSSGDQGKSNPAANRNINGWACVLTAEIDMTFLRTDLRSI